MMDRWLKPRSKSAVQFHVTTALFTWSNLSATSANKPFTLTSSLKCTKVTINPEAETIMQAKNPSILGCTDGMRPWELTNKEMTRTDTVKKNWCPSASCFH